MARRILLLATLLALPPMAMAAPPIQYEAQKLLASDGDSAYGVESGAAYVFTRDGNGKWSQQAKLLPGNASAGDLFGLSVAISGATVVIGAPGSDARAADSGAAYVFSRDGRGRWTRQAELVAGDAIGGERFGTSVAVSDDTALVGAPGVPFEGTPGSAYVYARNDSGEWSQQARLVASDGTTGKAFGVAVSLTGTTALIGAERDDARGRWSGDVVGRKQDRQSRNHVQSVDARMLGQALIPDIDHNGSREAAVLRVDPVHGPNVEIRDTLTKAWLSFVGFTSEFPPKALVAIPDTNGNGADDLALLGRRAEGGGLKVIVMDGRTGEHLSSVWS